MGGLSGQDSIVICRVHAAQNQIGRKTQTAAETLTAHGSGRPEISQERIYPDVMTHDGASLPLLYKDRIFFANLLLSRWYRRCCCRGPTNTAAVRCCCRRERRQSWTGNHGNAALLSVIPRPRLRRHKYVREPHSPRSAPA